MKRGKDDEKILEPLFPRLHVNDADKGGPRAPPRNKMALYEQLSIPSQRFCQQEMAPHNVSDTGSLVPPGPSNKACGTERNQYFHHQVYSSTPMQQVEKFVPPKSCMENVRSLAQHDQSKMAGEEDDFMVPVFLNSGRAQSNDRTKSGMDYEKISPVVVASCLQSVEILEANVKDPKNGLMTVNSKQEVRNLGKENPRQSTVLKSADLAKEEINESKSVSKRERGSNAHLRQESRNRLDQDGGETVVKGTDISQLRGENHSGKGVISPDLVENDHNRCRSRACISPHHGNGEASDGVSETSMVDSISSADISPDDVVRIIGQKRFWKARRAIANQQRVFAVQVFELHRLIKVQRLMAASPHLLLEDGTFVGKFSPKTSPVKKNLLGEYVVKPLPGVAKSKDDSEKNNLLKMECSAENAVKRTPSVSSSKNHNNNNSNHHQPSNFIPLVANNNPPAAPAATETQMTVTSGDGGSWCFPPQPHPGNHQWLMPVMSPSEGLVYKPYPNPGSSGSGCGEYYGQFIPAPMAVGNFMGGPVYGIPTPPPYHPGVGFPLPGPGYFSPYAVPTMDQNISGLQNTEKMSQFRHLGNTQQQSSCNVPNSNINVKAAAPPQPCQPVTKPCQWNKESSMVLQGSTGNNPSERGGSVAVDMSGNTLPLLPTNSAPDNSRRNKHLLMPPKMATRMTMATEIATTAKVIRVVPHNPKAASESAARIFRSIQEERKQCEFSA